MINCDTLYILYLSRYKYNLKTCASRSFYIFTCRHSHEENDAGNFQSGTQQRSPRAPVPAVPNTPAFPDAPSADSWARRAARRLDGNCTCLHLTSPLGLTALLTWHMRPLARAFHFTLVSGTRSSSSFSVIIILFIHHFPLSSSIFIYCYLFLFHLMKYINT